LVVTSSDLNGIEETFITTSKSGSPKGTMPKFKTTAEALKIVHNKDQIRNLGIIAHVDAFALIGSAA
jgi:hypothetical protein